jgi:hypothetical protein
VIRVGDPIIDTTGFVTLYCTDGDPVQFTAKPLGGTWTPPVGATGVFDPASITATLPANYMVLYTYVDPSGQPCASALGPITVNDLPVVSVEFDVLCSNDAPVDLGDQGTPVGGAYYINDNEEPVTELDPAVLTDTSYDLTYAYTDPNTGCSNSATTAFTVEVCVGLSEREANTLQVFPNPTSNGTVRITGQQPGDLFLYDATGRVLWQQRVISEAPIAIGDLATGVYRLVSRTADGMRSVGVVVE